MQCAQPKRFTPAHVDLFSFRPRIRLARPAGGNASRGPNLTDRMKRRRHAALGARMSAKPPVRFRSPPCGNAHSPRPVSHGVQPDEERAGEENVDVPASASRLRIWRALCPEQWAVGYAR